MAQQLRDVGETVSNMTVMVKVLTSLASKFSAFQSAWDNADEERQTIDNLTERLTSIRREARLGRDRSVCRYEKRWCEK